MAEGVETSQDMRAAAKLGLNLQQRYFLARPSCDQAEWATWPNKSWRGIPTALQLDLPEPA